MIVRVFRAKVRPGKAAELEQEIKYGSVSLVEAQQGVVTYFAGRPKGSNHDEFVMITIWENLAAVKAFAGADTWEQSVISETMAPLLEDSSLDHFEVFGTDLSNFQV